MRDIYKNLENRINDLGFDNFTFWISAEEAKDAQTSFGRVNVKDIKVELRLIKHEDKHSIRNIFGVNVLRLKDCIKYSTCVDLTRGFLNPLHKVSLEDGVIYDAEIWFESEDKKNIVGYATVIDGAINNKSGVREAEEDIASFLSALAKNIAFQS